MKHYILKSKEDFEFYKVEFDYTKTEVAFHPEVGRYGGFEVTIHNCWLYHRTKSNLRREISKYINFDAAEEFICN